MEQSEIKLFEGQNIRYVWDEQKEQYEIYMETQGNYPDLFPVE